MEGVKVGPKIKFTLTKLDENGNTISTETSLEGITEEEMKIICRSLMQEQQC